MSLPTPALLLIAVPAFVAAIVRVKAPRRQLLAFLGAVLVSLGGVGAVLYRDKRSITPPGIAAVPVASPDAGADGGDESPHSMYAAPTEDEAAEVHDSIYRGPTMNPADSRKL